MVWSFAAYASGSTLLVLRQLRAADLCHKQLPSFQNLRRKDGKLDDRPERPKILLYAMPVAYCGITDDLIRCLQSMQNDGAWLVTGDASSSCHFCASCTGFQSSLIACPRPQGVVCTQPLRRHQRSSKKTALG